VETVAFSLRLILEEAGALRHGHFLLSSGKHSDRYIEKFDLLRKPVLLEQACAEIARRMSATGVNVVAGPTTGGILIASELARQLGVRAAFAERSEVSGTAREFRRVEYFEPGDRVLVVDDILTTGGSVRETIAALRFHPVEIIGVVVLVDRSGGKVEFGMPFMALDAIEVPAWPPEECPLCERGQPLVKPGTTVHRITS
jgi:orotate phosphoribosyltransferase